MILKNRFKESDSNAVKELVSSLNISEAIAKILVARNCHTAKEALNYLRPSFNNLIDPFMFNDMCKAVNLIKDTISKGERIVIYGDYDVDGSMATSVLALGLQKIGGNIKCYIPNRHTEGYGMNVGAIDFIATEYAPSLIITVDCGISSKDVIAYAYSKGIKVIVSDHHEAPAELPACEAIIDAKVPGEKYPFKELCGAGVAGKIVWAVCGKEIMCKYRDLMAIATVADLVPLVGENRDIVASGIAYMNKIMRPGVEALAKYVDNGKPHNVTAYSLGYQYGPMINACGRLDDARECVTLMTTRDMNVATAIAEKLYKLNEMRKAIEETTVAECLKILKEDTTSPKKGIVLWSDNWESGVIGIVASRIQETYNCPVILLTYDAAKNNYHGSCRSINGINIYDLLCKCSKHIMSFGGHTMAAGLTVACDKLEDFKNAFMAEVNAYPDDVFEEVKYYDGAFDVNSIDESFVKQLVYFEPCGLGNPSPKFLLPNVSIKDIKMRGKKLEHFSCTVYDTSASMEAVAFRTNRPDEFSEYDLIVSPNINCFNGKTTLQAIISTMKKSLHAKNIATLSEDTVYGTRIVDEPLEILGLTEKKIKQFNGAGIYTLSDLVSYIPKKYQDFRYDKTVDKMENKETCSVIATVKSRKFGEKMVSAMCVDKNGRTFMACWFNQSYVYQQIKVGAVYIFCGQVRIQENGFVQFYPTAFDTDVSKLKTLKPVYRKIKNMSNDYLVESIKKALKTMPNTDYLERSIVSRFSMISEYDSIFKLHFPTSDMDIRDAQRRMVFDKLFKFNFVLKHKLSDNTFESSFPVKTSKLYDEIQKVFPYPLTDDQKKSIEGMIETMKSGERLNSLVQGDVGTGKTIVAFIMMAIAQENGFQSCIIAPTEVLAKQHYEGLKEIVEQFGLKVGYLTGGMKAKERREVLAGIEDGSIPFIVGTHAVIQDSVIFNDLGLVVIDEQHRFGVAQRDKLLSGEKKPHLITMSATPIPRTLSMALYGDHIQVYNIKTKPAGRKDIITVRASSDTEVNEFMLKEIRAGHQCYVVCPLIEDSESESMSSVKSVNAEVEAMEKYFEQYPEVKISNVTGKMKNADIAAEIDKFARLETNILISTTIIEVGVNVPNATVMVIKSSERFGLAQAHQLRGRVGRGDQQSYCLLQAAPDDPKADILCSTSDGFEIANQDMMLRGAGDYIGTSQTGNNKDVMLMLAEPDLYKEISALNDEIFADNARFTKYSYLIPNN